MAKRPQLARLPAGNRALLCRLARSKRIRVAIVSGRGLRDVKRKIGLPNLIYSGNHGLEIERPGRPMWVHPEARKLEPVVRRVGRALAPQLRLFPGAQLEDKGLSLSVHYRNLKPFLSPRPLRALLREAIGGDATRLRVYAGKKVWEVRPRVRWNKGDALLRLAGGRGEPWTIAFVGDDATDEDAFDRLGAGGLTVHVGVSRRSRARFRLKLQKQVRPFLEFIAREWSRK